MTKRELEILEAVKILGREATTRAVAVSVGCSARTVQRDLLMLQAGGLVVIHPAGGAGGGGGISLITSPSAEKRRCAEESIRTGVDVLAEGLHQHRASDRQLSRMLAREDMFLRTFEESAVRIFARPVRVRPFPQKRIEPEQRVVNVLLSDLHFGSRLDPREVPACYGPHEEARRLAKIVKEVCQYKVPHRGESTLAVHLAGDIIQGQLHDMRDGAPLAEQCSAATHLLHQAMARFAAEWPRVVVRCAVGNHGRNTSRHPGRAVHQKWDGHETMIYRALQLSLKTVANIEFHPECAGKIPLTPYYIYEQFGHRGFVTHGDTVFNPGSPNRSIDVGAVGAQIQRWNATETRAGRKSISVFAVGHVHIPSVVMIPGSGEWFISNGALLPADSFALSIGMTGTGGAQQLWETTERYPVGDFRALTVGIDTDKDAALEKIVVPFEM